MKFGSLSVQYGFLMVLGCCGAPTPTPLCEPQTGKVVRVLDDDTVELDTGERVRYLLVDTPETSSDDCFADDARAGNEWLVLGKQIELVYDDGQCVDALGGRLLAYIYVDGHMVNEALLERGYARTLIERPASHPGPYIFEESFLAIEADAKTRRAGLWGACP